MRVIHVRAGRTGSELVDEGAARENRVLGHEGHSVHDVRYPLAVPVDGGALVELVVHHDPHRFAFHHPQGGSGHHPVVGQRIRPLSGRHFPPKRGGRELEDASAGLHSGWSLHGTDTLSDGRESIALEGFNTRPVVGIHLLRTQGRRGSVCGTGQPCGGVVRSGSAVAPPAQAGGNGREPGAGAERSEETAARKRWAGFLLRTVSDWEVIHGTPP